MKYRVVLLAIPFHESLKALAELLELALKEAGLEVSLAVLPPRRYALENGTQDILLGAHGAPEIWDGVPPRTSLGTLEGYRGTPPPIVYQTENLLRRGGVEVPSWWRRLAMRAVIWDHSAMQAMLLGKRHVALGYVKSWVRPFTLAPFPDIDVLFIGRVNERTATAIDGMKALGLRTLVAFGVFGPPLDALIARSKVVSNVHFHEVGLFEGARVLPLIHRGVCVLNEASCDGAGREFCQSVAYRDLPAAAKALVEGERYLVQRAEDHVRLRQQRPLSAALLEALAASASAGGSVREPTAEAAARPPSEAALLQSAV